jgi:hypothetical protein
MLNSDPFGIARMLGPKSTAVAQVEAPGTPADVAAMHSYIAASPQQALPNLAPIPFIAQALLGRSSGMAPIPWFSQKVLGLGPPGTPIGTPTTAATAAVPAAAPAAPTNGLMPAPVDVAPLPPIQ